MKKDTFGIILLWTIAGAIAVAAVVYGINVAVDVAAKLAAAVIAAASVIMGAILNHTLASIRQQESQAQILRDQQTMELEKRRQENYAQLLGRISKFLTTTDEGADQFETIHLLSWVWGSPTVVNKTKTFMHDPKDESLRELLIAMRKDVGLATTDLPPNLDLLTEETRTIMRVSK